MLLDQLQGTGVRTPAIVWLSKKPTAAYQQWGQAPHAPLVTVTTAMLPWPWIAIAPAAMAKFKYPAECVAHRCPRHPYKGPLYYSLNTLHPALKTHVHEHHGDLALLAPQDLATDPP